MSSIISGGRISLSKAMACLLLAVYWFHPLVWTAWAVMCRDMEMSCDEKVLELIGKARKKEYSMALLPIYIGETHTVSFHAAGIWENRM